MDQATRKVWIVYRPAVGDQPEQEVLFLREKPASALQEGMRYREYDMVQVGGDAEIPKPQPPAGEWSAEDLAWLDKHVQPEMQSVARRWGLGLFKLVMRAGATNVAAGMLMQGTARQPALHQATFVVCKLLGELVQDHLHTHGWNLAQFMECKADVERIAELAGLGRKEAGAKRVSPGGIILDS